MKQTRGKRKHHESSGAAADTMRRLQAATGLRASGLAEAIGVAPTTVMRILRGEVCPSFDDMTHYAYRLGFEIGPDGIRRVERLRGYRSPKEIGDFVNAELEGGLDAEKLRVILRYIPKTVLDWRDLSRSEQGTLMRQPARIADLRFQALVEGAVRYFAHVEMWEEAPAWTRRTKLPRLFIPRAALREIGAKRFAKILMGGLPEFLEKNVLFSASEMRVV